MSLFFSEPQKFVNELKQLFAFPELAPCLRVCVTEKCNYGCFYCHKEGMENTYLDYLTQEDYAFLAKTFYELGIKKVKFTGGEPLLRSDLYQIIKTFKQAGFEDVSLITNGSLLSEDILKKLKESGLDRITISLHTLRKKAAMQISKSENIEKTKENAILARKLFEKTKINCVILPNINFPDEIMDIANFCRDNDLTLKFLSVLSEEMLHPLTSQALSIIKLYKQLTKKEIQEDRFVPLTRYYFSDGTRIEVNDFRNDEYRKRVGKFLYCKECPEKLQCVEGPYAIRIMPNGDIKSCLIRNDNIIKFKKAEKRPIKLICLTGLASSGKSSFREIARERFDIKSVYAGQILKDAVIKEKMPLNYENVMEISKKISQEQGQLGVMLKSFEVIEKELPREKVIVIDSVRSTEEYAFLSQFFKTYLVGLICSKKERFKRAKKGEFKLTTKQLIERDRIEMGEAETMQKFNVGKLLGLADYYISGELSDFEEKAYGIIKEIIND